MEEEKGARRQKKKNAGQRERNRQKGKKDKNPGEREKKKKGGEKEGWCAFLEGIKREPAVSFQKTQMKRF